MVAVALPLLLIYIALCLAAVAGWITNIVYAYHHFSGPYDVETFLSFLGIIFAPLGTLHGVYTWFN